MDKYKLLEMIESGMSMNDISKKEQKSLTTIRYWCNKFDIKSKHTSFKNSKSKSHNCLSCGETDPSKFNGHKKSKCIKCHKPQKYPKVKEWRKTLS